MHYRRIINIRYYAHAHRPTQSGYILLRINPNHIKLRNRYVLLNGKQLSKNHDFQHFLHMYYFNVFIQLNDYLLLVLPIHMVMVQLNMIILF